MNDMLPSGEGELAESEALPDCILAINGGSSSIKFGLFEASEGAQRIASGRIERIGMPHTRFTTRGTDPENVVEHDIVAPDQVAAIGAILDWIREQIGTSTILAVGHRLVHGGGKFWEPTRITSSFLKELSHLTPLDPEHMPEEIQLVEAAGRAFPDLPQFACFDTAFHHGMPWVARRIAIPRRYEALGVRRYGFHGISCSYLMEELAQVASPYDAQARVIIAHLGNGASLTAVHGGRSLDSSMGLTPASGIPMGTRSGDVDPGLAGYLARIDDLSPREFLRMTTRESGLLGISETSSSMADLLPLESSDFRAAEAIETFCYQARKQVCALAGVLEGLDTLVFSGGIGENCPSIRERICAGLGFLGIEMDTTQNDANASLISTGKKPVSLRVIPTDEERMIARHVLRALNQDASKAAHS